MVMDPEQIPQGLSSAEAVRRRRLYGSNTVFSKKRTRPLVALLKKFNSPLLLLLLAAALLSLFLGEVIQGVIIIVMVCISAALDFFNSYKSEQVSRALAAKVVTRVSVVRDGIKKNIPIEGVVPGDIVFLSGGAVVPADGVLIDAEDMFVNQSALTGESFPVPKSASGAAISDISRDARTLDGSAAVFMGASILTGFGTMRVERTGARTQYGAIAARLAAVKPETVFERDITRFSFFIMRLSFGMVAFVFLLNALFGNAGFLSSFTFAIAIAVGLTPELLPVIMSVSLAKGSLKMAEKKVVVRNLSSIHNFGAMDILATDKTGTLTEDNITLVKCVDLHGEESSMVREYAYLSSMFHTHRTGPLDQAIRRAAVVDIHAYKKIDEIPFDFTRKRDSIIAEKDGACFVVTKGAPEEVLGISVWRTLPDSTGDTLLLPEDVTAAADTFDRLSADGYRVLALAMRPLGASRSAEKEYGTDVEKEMVFCGFAAFLDPPKQTADDAIRTLETLNVEIKIITGDSEVLTERVCRDINLHVKGTLTGAAIRALSDSELERKAEMTTIFARVTPEEKERVIHALRKGGHTVGYLGDGINDAPALKAADVGISVDNAVDVAKETADLILLDKDLTVFGDGIREGRATFHNTMKYIKLGFSSNFGNMFSMMGVSAFLPFLPMLPGQILLNNMLYDISQTTLPTDRVTPQEIAKPLSWDFREIKRYMLWFGLVSSLFDFLTFFVLWRVFGLSDGAFQTGWFIESIATQVLVVYVIRSRAFFGMSSPPSRALVFSTLSVVLIAWILPITPLAYVLGFVPLPTSILFALGAIVLAYLFVTELVKHIFYATLKSAHPVPAATP